MNVDGNCAVLCKTDMDNKKALFLLSKFLECSMYLARGLERIYTWKGEFNSVCGDLSVSGTVLIDNLKI